MAITKKPYAGGPIPNGWEKIPGMSKFIRPIAVAPEDVEPPAAAQDDEHMHIVKVVSLAGPAGADGTDGKDGKDGKDGVDGKDGRDGIDGVNGIDGNHGKDGKAGPKGLDGKDGKDGRDGEDARGIKKIVSHGSDMEIELTDGSKSRHKLASGGGSSFGGSSPSLGTMAQQNANAVAVTGGTVNGTTVGATTASAGSFTTLNSSGATRLGGASGNQSLQVNNVASAVDYLQVLGNSGGFPNLSAQGASANVSIVYGTKGTGGHFFTTNGTTINQFVVSHTASAVNYAQFTGATTGSPIIISVQGSDTNVSLAYAPKGTGRHTFYSNSGTQLVVGNTASAVNYAQIDGAATGAAPTISAQGSDANIGLVLNSKGTGVVALGGSTAANSGFVVAPVTSAVNWLQGSGNVSLANPFLSSQGTDTNIGLGIITKGTGVIILRTGGGVQAQIISTASAVNYLGLTGAVTTGAPELSAQGSDTNINLKLTPKGTGVLQFGTYTAGVVAQAGYITITDAGGTSRRLLVG